LNWPDINNFGEEMKKPHTLVYWEDTGKYVGRIRELPAISAQADTLEELEESLKLAYKALITNIPEPKSIKLVQTKTIKLLSD
jgi:predicted RNase H-like HicB family nuclease